MDKSTNRPLSVLGTWGVSLAREKRWNRIGRLGAQKSLGRERWQVE